MTAEQVPLSAMFVYINYGGSRRFPDLDGNER